MLRLRVTAPFAAFRPFSAGGFRPTADGVMKSAAFGLLLNIAGVEMRGADDQTSGATLISKDLPRVRLAVGACSFPGRQQIFQQLHNYPVGTSGREKAPMAMGSKYNIKPVTRALLSSIDALIAVDSPEIEEGLRKGLRGESDRAYGLPFLGDNSFLPDRLEEAGDTTAAHWYCSLEGGEETEKKQISRFTTTIDRGDVSRSRTALFAPLKEPSPEIPPSAWVEVIY